MRVRGIEYNKEFIFFRQYKVGLFDFLKIVVVCIGLYKYVLDEILKFKREVVICFCNLF